jgi:hypothetical protein
MRKLVLLGLTIVGNQVHPCSYNGEKRTRLMGRKKVSGLILALALVGTLCVALETKPSLAWSNGGFSADPSNPDYGTHDWIAQHALDWLPTGEKEYIVDNLALYLYATELPDNGGAPGGIGDVALHHVYYWANESIQDDASAVRAQTEYDNAVNYMKSGDVAMAIKTLGIMSHYVVDVGVFGHVMGVGTDWGPEIHHSDYEDYVNTRTNNYTAEFDTYLTFDGTLDNVSAYDATLTLAFNTTFGDSGNYNCTWMDQNYDWNNAEFKNRCGESLNLAVNYLADVLHTLSRALAVSVSPDPASVHLLQSVTFTSITVGEAPPYSYQWYLNDSPVSGATSNNWTFALEPSGNYTTGTYSVYLNVTDSMGNNATSNQANVTVTSLFGDLNNDSKVDITDVSIVAMAFGSSPIRPRWNIQADVNQDGKVDITDVALVAKNFGKHYP